MSNVRPDPLRCPNTGKSFNRYVYAGNNPYKYIDPDGREIDIVGSKEFKKTVEKALKTIESKPEGAKLVGELRDSKFTIAISESKGENKTLYSDSPNTTNGKGDNSNVKWNPSNKEGGKDVNGNTKRPEFVGLAHELGHGKAVANGNQPDPPLQGVSGRTPRSEHESMKQENAVRKEQGIPLRGSYYE